MRFFSANVNICLNLGKWQQWSETLFWYFLSWILTYLWIERVILSLLLVFLCPLLKCSQIMLDIAIWIILRRSGKQKDFHRTILYFLPNLCDLVSSENWCLVFLCIAEDQMWVSPKSPIEFCFFLSSRAQGVPLVTPGSSKCCRWRDSTLPVTSEFLICEPQQGHLHILL